MAYYVYFLELNKYVIQTSCRLSVAYTSKFYEKLYYIPPTILLGVCLG
jgi:hypothetical protein